jgi:hypothetical protein
VESTESTFSVILIAVNLAAGIGFSIPIAKLLAEASRRSDGSFRYVAMLVGIYFLESVALAAGMGTQVFSLGLAFVWGVTFGLWLRGRAPSLKVLRASLFVAFYTCIPTATFGILLLAAKLIEGANVVSAEQGTAFGIPYFVPQPLNTILGFCVALVIGTVVLKTVITTGEISLLLHLKEKAAPAESNEQAMSENTVP